MVGAKCPAAAWGADEHGSTSACFSFFSVFLVVLCGWAAADNKAHNLNKFLGRIGVGFEVGLEVG